ncbi:MAG: hypothetical protein ACXWZ4_00370 [Gemmatirosa sp.]
MTSTLAELERKLHLTQIVRDNPWPAVGLAFGAGLLLSGSRADVKAAAATATATRGATSRLGPALDDIVASLMAGVGAALQGHVDTLLNEVKTAIGAPTDQSSGGQGGMKHGGASQGGASQGMGFAGDALGQRDGGSTGGSTGGNMGGNMGVGGNSGGSWAGMAEPETGRGTGSTAGMTPSSAGSQGMPRAD